MKITYPQVQLAASAPKVLLLKLADPNHQHKGWHPDFFLELQRETPFIEEICLDYTEVLVIVKKENNNPEHSRKVPSLSREKAFQGAT